MAGRAARLAEARLGVLQQWPELTAECISIRSTSVRVHQIKQSFSLEFCQCRG